MQIIAIPVESRFNPSEVQDWLSSHPSITMHNIWSSDDVFYIVFTE